MDNIYLVGMMGSGKSSTGSELAKLRSKSFVDLDQWLEKEVGATIPEIFENQGELYFRTTEAQLLHKAAQGAGQVIATGGGVVLSPENCAVMKKTGSIVYLKTGVETLWNRVKGSANRPLLKTENPKEALTELLAMRGILYEGVAQKTVETDGKTPKAVAQEINAQFSKAS